MKLTKCNNNHYYDADKYSACPHCSQTPSTEKTASDVSQIHSASRRPKHPTIQQNHESQKTTSLRARVNSEDVPTSAIMFNLHGVAEDPEAEAVKPDVSENPSSKAISDEKKESDSTVPAGSLLAAVNSVRKPVENDDTKTMAFYNFAESEPVVGWLVCVKGEYFGESFNLKTGRNTVGRSLKMDVALAKETSVSRDRHAVITYEPKKRKFYIQPGDVNGLTYVNDDLLMVPCEISDYNKIQIGDSEFILRVLCSENFSWDNYVR